MTESRSLPPWRPVAEGRLAERLEKTVHEVAVALRDLDEDATPRDAGLAHGDASLAVFFFYLGRAFPGRGWEEVSGTYLDRAIAAVATTPMGPSLYDGFTGVAWAIEHTLGKPLGPGAEDADDSIDDSIQQQLEIAPWCWSYDLIVRLIGCGVYGLERWPRPSAVRCLEEVIARLDETAVRIPDPDGEQITWWTDPATLPSSSAAHGPHGHHNLGVAHGIPAAIPLLAGICRAGVAADRARALLEGAMRWLKASRLPEPKVERSAGTIVTARRDADGWITSRPVWCCGDPGLAAALLTGARAVGHAEWAREAVELGLLAARRPVLTSGVLDAGISSGAAGLAHLFNRLHQASGEPQFAHAARVWLGKTLEMRRPDAPVGGFPSFCPRPGPTRVAEPGLLTGAAGVALVMLSAIEPVPPGWDRIIGCSLPDLAEGSAQAITR